MSSPKWTKEQQAVIDSRNSNLLVAAAAGSGKTAVLVERIIQMITDKDNPKDIDKLLVFTFTIVKLDRKLCGKKRRYQCTRYNFRNI